MSRATDCTYLWLSAADWDADDSYVHVPATTEVKDKKPIVVTHSLPIEGTDCIIFWTLDEKIAALQLRTFDGKVIFVKGMPRILAEFSQYFDTDQD